MMDGYGGLPIVTLQVQGFKHTVMHALAEREVELASEVSQALDVALSEENIRAVVTRESQRIVDEVVRSEVEAFYRRGKGREIVRRVIEESIAAAREWEAGNGG